MRRFGCTGDGCGPETGGKFGGRLTAVTQCAEKNEGKKISMAGEKLVTNLTTCVTKVKEGIARQGSQSRNVTQFATLCADELMNCKYCGSWNTEDEHRCSPAAPCTSKAGLSGEPFRFPASSGRMARYRGFRIVVHARCDRPGFLLRLQAITPCAAVSTSECSR